MVSKNIMLHAGRWHAEFNTRHVPLGPSGRLNARKCIHRGTNASGPRRDPPGPGRGVSRRNFEPSESANSKPSYNKIFERFKKLNDSTNRDIGSRIFQWLAYSSRPLKRFEVQDAVSLHSGNTIINESTRVLDSVFELCKPLIEHGASDTVRFVHVSVKELSFP
jgi:hypothetical protein